MNADIKQPIYHIFRDSLEVSPLWNLPSLLTLLTDCSVSAQFNASTHFRFCCSALDTPSHQNHHRHPSMLGISLTDIQWGSFSPLVALSLQELLVCPPSLHYINTRFVHNCPLRSQAEATSFICLPRTHTHPHTWMFIWPHMIALVFVFECTLGCLFVHVSVWNCDVSCADSFSANLAWSVGQLVLHRLTPPILLTLLCAPSAQALLPAFSLHCAWKSRNLTDSLTIWNCTFFLLWYRILSLNAIHLFTHHYRLEWSRTSAALIDWLLYTKRRYKLPFSCF